MRIAMQDVTPPAPPLSPGAGVRLLRRLGGLAAALMLAACAAQPTVPTATGTAPSAGAASPAPRVDAARPVPVALLLPLGSQRSADQAIARDMEDAARLAADPAVLNLTVIDTGASAAGAEAAARRAVAEGAALILGPTFAEEATSIASVAASSGVPALSFSSLAAAANPPVYILGFTPETEVARILRYAASQGLRRIALLHPDTPYGNVVRTAVMAEAPRLGQSVVSTTVYQRNFPSVQGVVGGAAAGIAAAQPDAVLVADSDQALVAVMSFLAAAGVAPGRQQFLGLKAWEEGRALRDASVRGGWYPAPDPAARDAFLAAFQSRHGRAPHQLASLAYDAVRAAGEMAAQARRTGSTAPFTSAAITQPAGFEGATGRFRLNPDGTVTRDLAIMEVGAGGPVLRAPAAPPGS